MNEANGYAVFFFPQALEALGEAIKPYLQEGAIGAHVLCNAIDTSGSLIEMTMRGNTGDSKLVVLELMVPVSMVRMIVSTQSDELFGFGPRLAIDPLVVLPAAGAATAAVEAPAAAAASAGVQGQSGQPPVASTPAASTGDGDDSPEG
ncbi:hypothetical protein [Cognatiluteimonas profundi]|uniref:hypothetical protein n=1 Tax=Cognatiluteimonas profundi TaxID=2594501 RepID=UPI00131B02B9|nr:hypothetical protein [Lysobacter profundi]